MTTPAALEQPDKRTWHADLTRDAEAGSFMLAKAMRREIYRCAATHGVTVRDATILLMNGVAL